MDIGAKGSLQGEASQAVLPQDVWASCSAQSWPCCRITCHTFFSSPAETHTAFWYLLNAPCLKHCPCWNAFSLNCYSSFWNIWYFLWPVHTKWAHNICSCRSCCRRIECQGWTVLQVSPCGSRGKVGHQLLMNHAAAVYLWARDHPTFAITVIVSGIAWCDLRSFAGFDSVGFFLTWSETGWIASAMQKSFKIVRLLKIFFFPPLDKWSNETGENVGTTVLLKIMLSQALFVFWHKGKLVSADKELLGRQQCLSDWQFNFSFRASEPWELFGLIGVQR